MVSEDEWPYPQRDAPWPPQEPIGLDRKARSNRIGSYQRIKDLLECRFALNRGPVQISVAITDQWLNAAGGRIEAPHEPAEILGNHSVVLVGYEDQKNVFKFINSWGTGWGDNGYGTLPYEYFDRFCFEAYQRHLYQAPRSHVDGHDIVTMQWALRDYLRRPFLVHEIYSQPDDENVGWAFASVNSGFVDVEELFVRPKFRRRKYGRHLLGSLRATAKANALTLRVFPSWPDCHQIEAVEGFFASEGLVLTEPGVQWAPCAAVARIAQFEIPSPPAYARARDMPIAKIVPLADDAEWEESESVGQRVRPTTLLRDINPHEPIVFVLSDWNAADALVDRVSDVVLDQVVGTRIPLVFVVDDVSLPEEESHHQALARLADAGAVLVVPDTEVERQMARVAPMKLVENHLLVALTHSSQQSFHLDSPSQFDGYEAFGHAVTRLSNESLAAILGTRDQDE